MGIAVWHVRHRYIFVASRHMDWHRRGAGEVRCLIAYRCFNPSHKAAHSSVHEFQKHEVLQCSSDSYHAQYLFSNYVLGNPTQGSTPMLQESCFHHASVVTKLQHAHKRHDGELVASSLTSIMIAWSS